MRDEHYVVEGWLERGGERLDLADAVVLLEDVVITVDTAARFDPRGAFTWAAALRREGRLRIPVEARALLDALTTTPAPLAEAPTSFASRRDRALRNRGYG